MPDFGPESARRLRWRIVFFMANQEHVEKLKEGVCAWNDWIGKLYLRKTGDHPDLTGANFFGRDLNDIDLAGARGTRLIGANLSGACIEDTRFAGAFLIAARFGAADARAKSGTVTYYAPAVAERLTRRGPNVADAFFGATTIDDIDLRMWAGLESAGGGMVS